MYNCLRCGSKKLTSIWAKCSDMCVVEYLDEEFYHEGYAPRVLHVPENFDDDYVDFVFCRHCGQIQHPDFRQDECNA